MPATASKKPGITDLARIKERTESAWIVRNNQIILHYYVIKAVGKAGERAAYGACRVIGIVLA